MPTCDYEDDGAWTNQRGEQQDDLVHQEHDRHAGVQLGDCNSKVHTFVTLVLNTKTLLFHMLQNVFYLTMCV